MFNKRRSYNLSYINELQNTESYEFEHTPSNEEMKKRTGTEKLKVCSVSLFRPKVRNRRYQQYYDGLVKYSVEFPKIFKINDGYILRLYIDASLKSDDYTYDDTNPQMIKRWDGKLESEKWKELLDNLTKNASIQIVEYNFPKLKLEDNPKSDYHKGYIGTISRFFSFVDPDVEFTFVRDIDSNVIEADLNSIEEFRSSPYGMHIYLFGYEPKHVLNARKNNKNYFKGVIIEDDSDNQNFIIGEGGNEWNISVAAGLFAVKYMDHEEFKKLWLEIEKTIQCEMNPKCYDSPTNLKYGIDEIVLNGPILEYFYKKKDIFITPLLSYKQIREMDFWTEDHFFFLKKKLTKRMEKYLVMNYMFEHILDFYGETLKSIEGFEMHAIWQSLNDFQDTNFLDIINAGIKFKKNEALYYAKITYQTLVFSGDLLGEKDSKHQMDSDISIEDIKQGIDPETLSENFYDKNMGNPEAQFSIDDLIEDYNITKNCIRDYLPKRIGYFAIFEKLYDTRVSIIEIFDNLFDFELDTKGIKKLKKNAEETKRKLKETNEEARIILDFTAMMFPSDENITRRAMYYACLKSRDIPEYTQILKLLQ